jgi:hypothetical protein
MVDDCYFFFLLISMSIGLFDNSDRWSFVLIVSREGVGRK